MFHFFFSHFRAHIFRNVSMILISSISILVVLVLVFIFQNASRAITYYNYNTIDVRRFTLSNETNYFDMFSRKWVWLPFSLVDELKADNQLSRVQSFSLVELPVLAEFALFDFHLETDIPVFSVTDTALTGSSVPIGISRAMLDFYNMKVAGTAAMLPRIPETFVKWQWVKVTFWASKIFPSLTQIASPIEWKITQIDENFPGFWITLPESIVKKKMWEIWYTLSPPYKIVAYMNDSSLIPLIEKKYGQYRIEFDATKIQKLNNQIWFMKHIFLWCWVFFISLFGTFFLFLLFSYFRERRDVFKIVTLFGLSGFRARMITLAEPLFLVVIWMVVWGISAYYGIWILVENIQLELVLRWISYILFPLSIEFIVILCVIGVIISSFIVICLEFYWRKKQILR